MSRTLSVSISDNKSLMTFPTEVTSQIISKVTDPKTIDSILSIPELQHFLFPKLGLLVLIQDATITRLCKQFKISHREFYINYLKLYHPKNFQQCLKNDNFHIVKIPLGLMNWINAKYSIEIDGELKDLTRLKQKFFNKLQFLNIQIVSAGKLVNWDLLLLDYFPKGLISCPFKIEKISKYKSIFRYDSFISNKQLSDYLYFGSLEADEIKHDFQVTIFTDPSVSIESVCQERKSLGRGSNTMEEFDDLQDALRKDMNLLKWIKEVDLFHKLESIQITNYNPVTKEYEIDIKHTKGNLLQPIKDSLSATSKPNSSPSKIYDYLHTYQVISVQKKSIESQISALLPSYKSQYSTQIKRIMLNYEYETFLKFGVYEIIPNFTHDEIINLINIKMKDYYRQYHEQNQLSKSYYDEFEAITTLHKNISHVLQLGLRPFHSSDFKLRFNFLDESYDFTEIDGFQKKCANKDVLDDKVADIEEQVIENPGTPYYYWGLIVLIFLCVFP